MKSVSEDAENTGRSALTWHSPEPPPAIAPPGLPGWLRAGLRGIAILLGLALGLIVLLPTRAAERALSGPRHPVSPAIVQAACRWSVWCLGLRCVRLGQPAPGPAVIASNHVSWLDILVLGAIDRGTFVAKAEVAGWPCIGALARATGTVFVQRQRRDAARQARRVADRIAAGDRLVLFPEGTSTDGQRVLAFRPTLFGALLAPPAPADLVVQPVSLVYEAPAGADPRFYGWWGDMPLVPHLVQVLAVARQGRVLVTLHAPLAVRDFRDRKALAAAARESVARDVCPV